MATNELDQDDSQPAYPDGVPNASWIGFLMFGVPSPQISEASDS